MRIGRVRDGKMGIDQKRIVKEEEERKRRKGEDRSEEEIGRERKGR